MSDITGPIPAPKIPPVHSKGPEHAQQSQEKNKKGNTEGGDGQSRSNEQSTQEKHHALDPAIALSPSVIGLKVGDQVKGDITRIDAEGHPVLKTPQATYVLEPDAGLKADDKAQLEILQISPTIIAEVSQINSQAQAQPIQVELTLVKVNTDSIQQAHQGAQSPLPDKASYSYASTVTKPEAHTRTEQETILSTQPIPTGKSRPSAAPPLAKNQPPHMPRALLSDSDLSLVRQEGSANHNPVSALMPAVSQLTQLKSLTTVQDHRPLAPLTLLSVPHHQGALPAAHTLMPQTPSQAAVVTTAQTAQITQTTQTTALRTGQPTATTSMPASTPSSTASGPVSGAIDQDIRPLSVALFSEAVKTPQIGMAQAVQSMPVTLSFTPAENQPHRPQANTPLNLQGDGLHLTVSGLDLVSLGQLMKQPLLADGHSMKMHAVFLPQNNAVSTAQASIAPEGSNHPHIASEASQQKSGPIQQGGISGQGPLAGLGHPNNRLLGGAETGSQHKATAVSNASANLSQSTGEKAAIPASFNDVSLSVQEALKLSQSLRTVGQDTAMLSNNITATDASTAKALTQQLHSEMGLSSLKDSFNQWPLMTSIAQQVATLSPAEQAQFSARVPTADQPMGPKALFYLAALGLNDPKTWIGQTPNALPNNQGNDLLKTLFKEFSRLFQSAAHHDGSVQSSGEWRPHLVPIFQNDQAQAMLILDRPNDNHPKGDDGDDGDLNVEPSDHNRFVVAARFPNLGLIELDGLLKTTQHQLDLILRSSPVMDPHSQSLLDAIAKKAFERADINGSLRFSDLSDSSLDIADILERADSFQLNSGAQKTII